MNPRALEGKVAVVTGSTRGLGRAIAEAFAAAGAAVVVSGRHLEPAQEVASAIQQRGGRAIARHCDVSNLEDVRALADAAEQELGGLDIWVNNAGVAGPYGPTMSVPPKQFLATVQTNVIGTYHGSRIALERMAPRGRGRLINVLGRGDHEPVPLQNAYASSKAWVRNFTVALATEYADSGVGIHAINPGMMDTALLRHVDVVAGYEAKLKVMPTLIRMWGKKPEVPAAKVLWLASDETEGRTGLEVRLLGRGHLLAGAMRELGRRVTRRPAPPPIEVRVIGSPPRP